MAGSMRLSVIVMTSRRRHGAATAAARRTGGNSTAAHAGRAGHRRAAGAHDPVVAADDHTARYPADLVVWLTDRDRDDPLTRRRRRSGRSPRFGGRRTPRAGSVPSRTSTAHRGKTAATRRFVRAGSGPARAPGRSASGIVKTREGRQHPDRDAQDEAHSPYASRPTRWTCGSATASSPPSWS
jgi:hypothetical protein